MPRIEISLGSAPNAKDGDNARTAYDKCNQNFQELYDALGGAIASLKPEAAHGFPLNDLTPVYWDGANWLAADATAGNEAAQDPWGLALPVDADSFYLYQIGPLTVSGLGLTAPNTYYLAIGGGLTDTAPTGIGVQVVPMWRAETSDSGFVINRSGWAADAEPLP